MPPQPKISCSTVSRKSEWKFSAKAVQSRRFSCLFMRLNLKA